ncbi:MAG: hypothetical protein AABO41_04020 [Acidobacteriota bacterium]
MLFVSHIIRPADSRTAGATFTVVFNANDPGAGCPNYKFTVSGLPCFDFCVQDDLVPGKFIKISSTSGAYEFHECTKNIVLTGTGTPDIFFCKVTVSDGGGPVPNRSVNVALNPCTAFGNAQIRLPGSKIVFNISDSNIFDNTCACPGPTPPPPPG